MRKIATSFWKVAIVTIFIALLISVIPIQATDYTVGVKVGDWMKYGEFHASTTGTGTGLSQIADMNNIDWMKMEVKGVTGTEVTMESSGKFKNGTTSPTSTIKINVATGSGSAGFFVVLIAADLQEEDSIVQQQQAGGLAVKINSTVTRTYCGAMRSVNCWDVSMAIPEMGELTAKWYWDKATGIMLETFTEVTTTTPTVASIELSLKAVETNMWSADVLGLLSTYLLYIVGIVALAIVIVVSVFIFRRRKPTPPVTPLTATEAKPE